MKGAGADPSASVRSGHPSADGLKFHVGQFAILDRQFILKRRQLSLAKGGHGVCGHHLLFVSPSPLVRLLPVYQQKRFSKQKAIINKNVTDKTVAKMTKEKHTKNKETNNCYLKDHN